MAITAHGRTCMACGLVVDEEQEYVVYDQRGKEGFIASHAVFHDNTTTLVGSRHERANQASAKLGLIQQRLVSYADTKRSRVYHFVRGLVNGMQLPEIVIDSAMHLHDKLLVAIPKGAAVAGPDLLGGISTFIACKQLGVAIDRDALVERLDMTPRAFFRAFMRVRAIHKHITPAMPSAAKASIVIDRVLSTLREIGGDGDYQPVVESIYRQVAKAFMGIREDTRIAVTAYIAAQVAGIESASFTSIASTLHFLPSSLYNAVNRVLAKLGIAVTGSLSRANIAAHFQQPMVLPDGVVKVAPVPVAVTKPVPIIVVVPTVSPVNILVPVQVPASIPAALYAPSRASVPRGFVIDAIWRKRGRPRKIQENHVVAVAATAQELHIAVRRGPGRPRKNQIHLLPGLLVSPFLALQGLPGPPVELTVAPG